MNTYHETFVQKFDQFVSAINEAAFLTNHWRRIILTTIIEGRVNLQFKVADLKEMFAIGELEAASEHLAASDQDAIRESLQRLVDAQEACDRIIKTWAEVQDLGNRSEVKEMCIMAKNRL